MPAYKFLVVLDDDPHPRTVHGHQHRQLADKDGKLIVYFYDEKGGVIEQHPAERVVSVTKAKS